MTAGWAPCFSIMFLPVRPEHGCYIYDEKGKSMRSDGLIVRSFKDRQLGREFYGVKVTPKNLDALAHFFSGKVDGSYRRGTGDRQYRIKWHTEEGGWYYASVGQWVLKLVMSDQLMAIENETLERMFIPIIDEDEVILEYLKNRTWTLKGSDILDAINSVGESWDGGVMPEEALTELLSKEQSSDTLTDPWNIFWIAEMAKDVDRHRDIFEEGRNAMIDHINRTNNA